MTLAMLLKLAQALGLPAIDLEALKKLAIEQGTAAGRAFLRKWVEKRLESGSAAILANLKTKAPIDGQKRKDKDGIEMTDAEFFLHEASYLLVKRIINRGGLAIDGVRDRHFPKTAPRVLAAVPEGPGRTQESLLKQLIREELELTLA